MNNELLMSEWHDEQDAIFEQFMEDCFFRQWRTGDPNKDGFSLELILFPNCNYKCTYCYVTNHGRELFPPIDNEQPEMIIDNTAKILRWVCKNKFKLNTLDIFSAEFFAQSQWEDIFKVIYDTMISNYVFADFIVIPTNMSFVMDNDKLEALYKWIEKFKRINVTVHLSGSIDGLHCDNITRPGSVKYNEEFYDKVFTVAKKIHGGFHPMIASTNVHVWKDNLKWFISMYKKHTLRKIPKYPDTSSGVYRYDTPFLLEVRNDDWTPETISLYTDFLEYEFELLLNDVFGGDIEWFATNILKISIPGMSTNMQNTMLTLLLDGRISCSMQKQLFVRPRYMDIVPCHRTCYEQNQYGSFKLDKNGEICGLKANNIPLAMKIYEMNLLYSMPKCCNCKLVPICIGQCHGAMYEANKDLFTPTDSVCSLFEAKYKKIYELYKKYDIFNVGIRVCEKADAKNWKDELTCRRDLICRIMEN